MITPITVTFGGREVRLTFDKTWQSYGCDTLKVSNVKHNTWVASTELGGRQWAEFGDTAQASASALEAKLREHYQAIGKILGEQSTGHRLGARNDRS